MTASGVDIIEISPLLLFLLLLMGGFTVIFFFDILMGDVPETVKLIM